MVNTGNFEACFIRRNYVTSGDFLVFMSGHFMVLRLFFPRIDTLIIVHLQFLYRGGVGSFFSSFGLCL